AKEVLDRLRLGLWTVLRDSSLRPDLDEVVRAVTEHGADTRRLCMTVDGPNPTFIEERGFVDGLIRRAVSAGVPPVQAVQMATINAATYLGLDDVLGGIAPGRRADAVVVKDLRDFCADMVLSAGRVVAERGRLSVSLPKIDWKRYQSRAHFLVPESVVADPALYAFPVSSVRRNGQRATVPVIRFRSAVITERVDYDLPVRSDYVSLDDSPGLTYAALVDSDGQWITHAVVSNFVPLVDGMASTYNTTTHLLVMGRDPVSMARAVARVHAMEGGIALYQEGEERFCAALPFTGMMIMDHRFETALRVARGIAEAVREAGYPFHDILYSLLFLTCDFLPGLRITPSGVIDVKSKAVVIPATGPLVTRITREDSVSPGVGRRARSISLGKGGRE
ncbi:adenine deaminase C-terminal domain-containing protein, partial [Alicyclobacillus sendaiensis]|uniref:adenine deaminase C-terminal domain-containing protein n=1 Tax=Alicyclobacillus sendaiensis TaxID=192387 RepID=UPI0026F44970